MKSEWIICHYAEIGVKGKNRSFFEKILIRNIQQTLQSLGRDLFSSIIRKRGRILVHLTKKGSFEQVTITDRLQNTFGIAYCAPARKIPADMETIKEIACKMMSGQSYDTFRITTRKTYSDFSYSKLETNEIVGAHIVSELSKKVKLKNPDLTCYIDILEGSVFIYDQRYPGPGGLPVGVSGNVAVMISGGIDSPVAAYYALKRGARALFVHFHSIPYTDHASLDKVREIVEILTKYQSPAQLICVPLAPIQKEIMTQTDHRLRVILYRRFMLRITEMLAKQHEATAIVTGESLGQVASQTLENLVVIEEACSIPILRPLIGFDKLEIVNLAQRIGTYETSIEPDQDCCSLFVPKNPATKARIYDVARNESLLAIDELVREAVEDSESELIGME